jgi:hypothetical protein
MTLATQFPLAPRDYSGHVFPIYFPISFRMPNMLVKGLCFQYADYLIIMSYPYPVVNFLVFVVYISYEYDGV